MSHPELAFFNNLSGKLKIELTEPPERVGNLSNERAPADAEIKSISLNLEVFNQDDETFRALTKEELATIAFHGASIVLQSEDGEEVSHNAPNGESFTVADLAKAVEETERQTRGDSEWLGGIDVHHVYFEGLEEEDGVWLICWGS